MPKPTASEIAALLSIDRRQAIFAALVELQDGDDKPDVNKSRWTIARQFDVDGAVVRAIEEEGLREDWPPLDG